MPKPKPTLNQTDISLLRSIFATKDDLKNELNPLKKDIRKIKKDINMVIDHFDHSHLELRARVDRIENYLKIPPLTT